MRESVRESVRDSVARYGGLVRSSTQSALTYRGRIVIWLLTGFFPLLLLAVWLTVVQGSGPPRGWTSDDFVAYYVAAAVLWHLSGQHVVWEWDADLRSGDLSVRLLRPVHPFHQYTAADVGVRIVTLGLLLPVVVTAVWLVPGLDYPFSAPRVAAVVLAVLLAYAVSLLMASLAALIAFWSTQATNVWLLWWGIGSFASGWVAPLDLMPDWLRRVALVLPFRTTMGFPIDVVTGRADGQGIAAGFAVGTVWLVALVAAYTALWRPAVRRYQAVSG